MFSYNSSLNLFEYFILKNQIKQIKLWTHIFDTSGQRQINAMKNVRERSIPELFKLYGHDC